MTLEGGIRNGEIFLPPLEMEAHGVDAEAVISKGVLTGRDISASVAGSQVSAGTFEMGLMGPDAPIRLEVKTHADLVQVPSMLSRLMKGTAVGRQVSVLRDVRGSAAGKVFLDGTLKHIRARVDLSAFRLHARDPRLPWPVDILSGQASYDGRELTFRELRGSVGRSDFSGLSVLLPLSASRVHVSAAASRVDLGEVYPWIRSLPGAEVALPDIESLKGILSLNRLEAHGPIGMPGAFQFKVSGAVKDVALGSPLLPGVLSLATGEFEADPEMLSFRNAGVSLLDASLHEVSGAANGLFQRLKGANASFQGSVGPRATAYVYKLARVPAGLLVRSPLTVTRAQVSWIDQTGTHVSAAFSVEDGPEVAIDGDFQPQAEVVRKLSVSEGDSEASFTLDLEKREFGGSFEGTLSKATLDRLLVNNSLLKGRVQGTFSTHISLEHPIDSTAEGSLSGTGLLLPGKEGPALEIDELALEARTPRIDLQRAALVWGGSHLNLQGSAEFVEKWIRFDTEVSADHVKWDQVRTFWQGTGPSRAALEQGVFWTLPIYGACAFRTDAFTYRDFSWRPLRIEASLRPDDVSVEVKEAQLCGISTPGRLSISPRSLALDFSLSSRGRRLEPTLECLVDHTALATGHFNLEAEVNSGTKEDPVPHLLRGLEGHWQFTARDGRINRFGLLASILSVLDFTPYLRGRLPDLSTGSFPYHSIDAQGGVGGGKIEMTEMLIRSSSLQIASQGDVDLVRDRLNLNVLVAPFPLGATDFVVHEIPLLGKILGTSILSFPVSVSGPVSDPTVIPFSPTAVASSLLGIMRRTVEMPLTVVRPLLPGEGEGAGPSSGKHTGSGPSG